MQCVSVKSYFAVFSYLVNSKPIETASHHEEGKSAPVMVSRSIFGHLKRSANATLNCAVDNFVRSLTFGQNYLVRVVTFFLVHLRKFN